MNPISYRALRVACVALALSTGIAGAQVLQSIQLPSLFRTTVDSWARGTQFIDANQRRRSTVDLVKKQISSIYALFAPIDPQEGGGIYPIFAGSQTSVQFITLNSLRFRENPGLTMVSYDLVPDSRGDHTLVERERLYLGLNPMSETLFDPGDERPIPIFENLTEFVFEYFDPGTSEQPPQWVRAWDGREALRIPAALSMTMIVRDSKGGLLNRQLVIPIQAKPNDPRNMFQNPFGRGF